ncbi:hypothetical protein NQ317_003670 [Molorchus minor]|uniref:Uncharacterized protein n=1 Tax=Molorchus minor TaxID=1323400 RepID=A0ABQ9JQR1_9CUCU|nr:hypothetical protein NQ317_003670 [Molorchus minor]
MLVVELSPVNSESTGSILHSNKRLQVSFKEFLVKQKFSKSTMLFHQFFQSGNFTSNVTLPMVLFIKEIASEIIDKLSVPAAMS